MRAWGVVLALGFARPVQAQGFDVDVELLRPVFAPGAVPGLDVADGWRGGSVRWGVLGQYTRSALVLYEFDREVGTVVADRFTTFAGVSVDVSPRVTFRAVLPLVSQSGATTPRYQADGVGLGDASVGGHWVFWRRPHGGLGLALDLTLPTSRVDAYAGERLPRLLPALLAHVDVGRVRLATSAGAQVRFDAVDTQADLVLGSELLWNTGVQVTAMTDRVVLGASVLTRWGLSRPGSAAESSGELVGTLAVRTARWLWLDVGGGRGFTRGYGSSGGRAWVALRFEHRRAPLVEIPPPPPPAPPPEPVVDPPERVGPDLASAPPPVPAGPVFDGTELVLDEEIRFHVGTARLQEASLPVVDRVADHLNGDARYGHVVIVGYASEEGEHGPNYALSLERAGTILRRLVEQGVAQERLSIRGVGEVLARGEAEATRAQDRRVRFLVTQQIHEVDLLDPPHYDPDARCPWDGEPCPAVQPVIPPWEVP
ncbi:MAG: OmpA family protein [Alphaproteobacteria bacterium]|nr:OmpA family protein [Alphaproteobacteria bacterium]